jgi:hypothetical protein
MIKNTGLLAAVQLVCMLVFSQREQSQRPALGIYFFFHDFKTVEYIRASSLSQVIRNRRFGKLNDMSPGLAINYFNGLSSHFDFSTTFTGAFLDYTFTDGTAAGQGNLLMEGDVSIKAKLLSNRHHVTPFFQIGTGISKYKGYWGALIPAGIGLQVSFFDEAYLVCNAQYRIAVTPTVSEHFFYSIGLAGIIGRKKNGNGSVLPE